MERTVSPALLVEEWFRDFRCDRVEVRPSRNIVAVDGVEARVGSVVMNVLVALARREGELATKAELFAEVWSGRSVSDDVLTVAIYELRKLLGDRARSPRFIETIPGRGYRWIPTVEWLEAGGIRGAADTERADPATSSRQTGSSPSGRRWLRGARWAVVTWVLVILGIAGGAAWWFWARAASPSPLLEASATIAVLPFADYSLSYRPGERRFVDGMTDTLILELARISPIPVLSRTSAMHLTEGRESLPELAQQLGADLLIEGMVVREGRRVRIGVQLIDGRNDHHLWAETFEVELERALDVQAEIAAATAREIFERLPAAARGLHSVDPRPAAGPMPEVALDAYLRGLEAMRQISVSGLDSAVPAFREANELAPGHAAIWARLSETHTLRSEFGVGPFQQEVELARSTAERALALDPGSPAALHSMGLYELIIGWNLESAEDYLRRSLASDSMHAPSWQTLCWVLLAQQRPSEALAAGRRAALAAPHSELATLAVAIALWVDGQAEEASRILDEGAHRNGLLHRTMAQTRLWILIEERRSAEAWDLLRGGTDIPPGEVESFDALWAEGGLDAVLAELLARAESAGSRGFSVTLGRVWAGDLEGALDLLEVLAELHNPYAVSFNYHPSLRPLHGLPRFEALLDSLGMPRPE